MSIIGTIKHGFHHAAHQVEHEVDHDAHAATHEVDAVFQKVIDKLEDSSALFLHAIENGLLEHAVNDAASVLQKSPIQPPAFRLGFEFLNVGFHITIVNIPEKLPILLQYAEGKKSLRSAKDIKAFVLALSPTSLKPTIFGNGPDFSAKQVYDAIDGVLHELGIE